MKLTCDRDDLAESINLAMRAVSSRTTLNILECVLLIADEDNCVRLIGNDLEIGIETKPIEAQVLESGCIALEAKMFSEIVRKLPPGEVLISTDENNIAFVKSGKAEFKIFGQSGEEFPFLPEVEKGKSYAVPANIIKNMVRQTIFSIAVDESKPIMTGELFEIKNNSLMLVAFDGFRLSIREAVIADIEENREENDEDIAEVAIASDIIKVVVPGKTLSEISKMLPDKTDPVLISFSEKHIIFDLSNCVLVSRLIEGNFLNYENVFTNDYTTLVYVNKDDLLDSLERTTLINKDLKKRPVKLKITEDKIIITQTTEMGTSYDEVGVEIDGMPLEIGFNPKYLIDALKAIDESEICMQLKTPLSPCIILNEEVGGYKYLVMPLGRMN